MKSAFTFLLVLFLSASGFSQIEPNTQFELNKERIILLNVQHPGRFDLSQHMNMYGCLGPESFAQLAVFKLLDEKDIIKYGNSISIMIDDLEAKTLNELQSECLVIRLKEPMPGCFGGTIGGFTLLSASPYIGFCKCDNSIPEFSGSKGPINDIYPETLTVTVKSNSIKSYIPTVSSINKNWAFENAFIDGWSAHLPEREIETLFLADSVAMVLYGRSIQVVKSNSIVFDESKLVRVTLQRVKSADIWSKSYSSPLYYIKKTEPVFSL